jgi:mono/diheme cytochrome c family protein
VTARNRQQSAITILVVAILGSAACRRGPQAQPGDPMIDAIRAEEREGHLNYGEGQGRRLFVQYCVTCHGDSARGDGQNASNLIPAPPDMTTSKDLLDRVLVRRIIAEGSAAIGRSPLSPPWGRNLSAQEIDYLVVYCQSLVRKSPQ